MKMLDIVPANLWRENPAIEKDVALLASTRSHFIVTNESRKWVNLLRKLKGYRLIVPEEPGNPRNNCILVRDDVKVIDSGSRKMCDKVGISPERWATWVGVWWDGVKVAVISTHTNSHIQEGPNDPHELPRVDQLIEHVHNLGQLRKQLLREYDTVIIAGDLNWDYSPGALAKQWRYAPRVYFARWGMTTNWAFRTAPRRGTHGKRQIDYVAFALLAWTVSSQVFIKGEHSDHNWLRVRLRPRRRAFRRWRIRRAGTQG